MDLPTASASGRVAAPGVAATAVSRHELSVQSLFRGVDIAAIEPVLHGCETWRLAPGEELIAVGRPNHALYLVLSGRLRVHLQSPAGDPLTYIEVGETAGELSLIDGQPASASVVADTETRVLVLEEAVVWTLTNTSQPVSRNLLFSLVERMRFGNAVIHRSQERLEHYRFHATVDALTGLFNRRWLDRMLPRQMQRAGHCGEPMSLLVIDVDRFKVCNDRFGHGAGDLALCAVARALRDGVRPADMVARYGGDEFVVILPDCGLDAARRVGERLREAVAGIEFQPPGHAASFPLSISVGVAEHDGGASPRELFAACDAALYRAKQGGRGRVEA